jgi:hypothetical protein
MPMLEDGAAAGVGFCFVTAPAKLRRGTPRYPRREALARTGTAGALHRSKTAVPDGEPDVLLDLAGSVTGYIRPGALPSGLRPIPAEFRAI